MCGISNYRYKRVSTQSDVMFTALQSKPYKQYAKNNLMQYALSYRDAFWPCSKVSSGDNGTIYTSPKQNIHIVRLS